MALEPNELRTMNSQQAAEAARGLESAGDFRGAAAAWDRAYGLDPRDPAIALSRAALLDHLAVTEHGLRFHYVPAGSFLMGSEEGDPDEQPVHTVEVGELWLTETPVSWADYCRLMGWLPPPEGMPEIPPEDAHPRSDVFRIMASNRIRLQYCETHTTRAMDWHTHAQHLRWQSRGRTDIPAKDLFGEPPRSDPAAPWTYDRKPMVAVAWQEAEALAGKLSSEAVEYRLPTEAEWEKAARGGLIGCRYAWGNDPPTPEHCDFGALSRLSLLAPRTLTPNGYGLYGMCGGVWEWTGDWYDAEYYAASPGSSPRGPAAAPETDSKYGPEKVLRGGSWCDSAEAVTVSFRMSRASRGWWEEEWGRHYSPNIGFRLARVERRAG